jgi:PAS domain-containing protein
MPLPHEAGKPAPGSEGKDRQSEPFRDLFDAIPSPALIVDRDVRILEWNEAAEAIVGSDPTMVLHMKTGDAVNCLNSTRSPGGCGHSKGCHDCVIRNTVGGMFNGIGEVLKGGRVTRRRTRLHLTKNGRVQEVYLLVTASPLWYQGEQRALLILEDISELITLQGLLPICAWCRRVRNTDSYWESIEQYLKNHVAVDFTHSICQDCYSKVLSEPEAES